MDNLKKRFQEALENGESSELFNAAKLSLEDRGIEDIVEVECVSLKKNDVKIKYIYEHDNDYKYGQNEIPIEELFEKIV